MFFVEYLITVIKKLLSKMYLVYSTSTLYGITEIDSEVLRRSQEMLQKYRVCVCI